MLQGGLLQHLENSVDEDVVQKEILCSEIKLNWSVVLQVNLSMCTKAVDPGLEPLCPQDVYLNENPEDVYKKLLCCDTCAVKDTHKKNLLPISLAVVGTSVVVIILILVILVLASKYRAARKYVREIQEGRDPFQSSIFRPYDVHNAVQTALEGRAFTSFVYLWVVSKQ